MSMLNFNVQELLRMVEGIMHMVVEVHLKDKLVTVWHCEAVPEMNGKKIAYDAFWDTYLEACVSRCDHQKCKDSVSLGKVYRSLSAEKKHWRFELKFRNKRLSTEWHELAYHAIDQEKLLLTLRQVSEAHTAEIVNAIIQNEYEYVIYLNLAENSYVMYDARMDKNMTLPSSVGDDYEKDMVLFNRRYIIEEEQNELIEKMRLQSIVDALAEDEEYILYCTSVANGVYRDKKLRFTYLHKEEQVVLLTGRDITQIREQQRRNHQRELDFQKEIVKNQEKMLGYFEEMPIAFCIIRLEVDEHGEPYDFVFTYLNAMHAELEKTTKEELLHKSFYQFFSNADRKWLKIYHKTAYQGIKQRFTDYSPEIGRYLEIYTYQPEFGYCGCILQDVTESLNMAIEIEKIRERESLLLSNTTDAVFQYDLEKRVIYSQPNAGEKYNVMPEITDIPYGLLKHGLILEEGLMPISRAISTLEEGEKTSSCEVMARLTREEEFYWHNVFFSSYIESHTGKRRVIGFLKNINAVVLRRKWLEKTATLDNLTGLMNLATARMKIEKILSVKSDQSEEKKAFFMFDLDNFKEINDQQGHAYGDLVLQKFADVLRKSFRYDQVVFRHGGDEFAAFIGRLYDKEAAERICENIFAKLEQLKQSGMDISVSAGVFVGSSASSYEEYYQKADAFLYHVKEEGKHAYFVGGE